MKTSKITNDTELRIWCVQQCTDAKDNFNLNKVKELYAFVSASTGESAVIQKTPHANFFSRLCLKICNWRKRL